ncbi:hypothetical protein J2X06_001896 [Lysobacter niastensis]|uniref:Uncharacterized protein n=1 Tax=Lysobacter niastensis TaxID=380629 RepID=A0ABU1WB79_9GAMM|nr:hypothetical protein [Lysobacter niastensis]MDR7134687.1 hypothetical protein [Lysobacter niastensis]
MLLPALMVAALVAPSARAIDLGLKTGAAVQAGPVQADVSAATDARATAGAARESGARTARETGNQVSGTAHAVHDAAGGAVRRAGHDTAALTAAAQVRADAAGARDHNADAAQTRTDARLGAQGSLQANDRAKTAVGANARASASSAIGGSEATATPPPEGGGR